MEYAISSIVSILQYLAMIIFLDAFFRRKYQGFHFWWRALLWILLTNGVIQANDSVLSHFKMLQLTALLVIEVLWLYQGHILSRIFLVMTGNALFSVLGYGSIFAVMSIFQVSFKELYHDTILYWITAFSGTLALILFAVLVRHFHSPSDETQKAWKWTLASFFFPFSCILVLFFFYSAITHDNDVGDQNVYAIISIFLMGVANMIVPLWIDFTKKSIREHEMLVVLKERERAQKESISALSAAYQTQRKMTHDFQKHLSVLSDLLQSGNSGQASSYLSQLRRDSTERILLVDTHHAAVDAILNQKGMAAQQNKIDIRFEVNDLSGMKIKETDCTVVLGNLLDNAIEACEKLPERERWIQVSVTYTPAEEEEPGSLFLSVLNASPFVKISSGQIATTKENASFHGFGLRNVQDILKKYQADYDFSYENGQFVFSVEWPEHH